MDTKSSLVIMGSQDDRLFSRDNSVIRFYDLEIFGDMICCSNGMMLVCNSSLGVIQELRINGTQSELLAIAGTDNFRLILEEQLVAVNNSGSNYNLGKVHRAVNNTGPKSSFWIPYMLCEVSDGSILVAEYKHVAVPTIGLLTSNEFKETNFRRIVFTDKYKPGKPRKCKVETIFGDNTPKYMDGFFMAREGAKKPDTRVFRVSGMCACRGGGVIFVDTNACLIRRIQVTEGNPTYPKGFITTLVGGGQNYREPGYADGIGIEGRISYGMYSNLITGICEYVDGSYIYCENSNLRMLRELSDGRFRIETILEFDDKVVMDCVCDYQGRLIVSTTKGIFIYTISVDGIQEKKLTTDIEQFFNEREDQAVLPQIQLSLDFLGNLYVTDSRFIALIQHIRFSLPFNFHIALKRMISFSTNIRQTATQIISSLYPVLPNEVKEIIRTILLVARRNDNMEVERTTQLDKLNKLAQKEYNRNTNTNKEIRKLQNTVVFTLPKELWEYCITMTRLMDFNQRYFVDRQGRESPEIEELSSNNEEEVSSNNVFEEVN